MKVLFVLALVAAVAYGKSVVIKAEGPRCPIKDPLDGEPGLLNISMHPVFELFVGATHGPIHVTGLSTLWYDIDINAIALTINFHSTLDEVDLSTEFDAQGWIDARPLKQETVPSGNFTGVGMAKVKASAVEIQGSATLFINIIGNKVTLRILNLDTVSFGTVEIDLGAGFIIAGAPVDWATWSAGFPNNWATDFLANKEPATEKIRESANNIIGQFTLQELIDLIGGGGGEPEPCPEQ